jgi:hypothetical protein
MGCFFEEMRHVTAVGSDEDDLTAVRAASHVRRKTFPTNRVAVQCEFAYRLTFMKILRRMGFVPLAVAAMLAASPAAAEESTAAGGEEYWYGWQTLIVVGSSLTLTPLYGAGVAGMVLGPPIVHWAHGHVGKGFASLGMNIGATGVGSAIGVGIMCGAIGCSGDFGGFSIAIGLALGGGIGILTANAIDIGILSYEPKQRGASASRQPFPFTITPQVFVGANGGSVGLAGTF